MANRSSSRKRKPTAKAASVTQSDEAPAPGGAPQAAPSPPAAGETSSSTSFAAVAALTVANASEPLAPAVARSKPKSKGAKPKVRAAAASKGKAKSPQPKRKAQQSPKPKARAKAASPKARNLSRRQASTATAPASAAAPPRRLLAHAGATAGANPLPPPAGARVPMGAYPPASAGGATAVHPLRTMTVPATYAVSGPPHPLPPGALLQTSPRRAHAPPQTFPASRSPRGGGGAVSPRALPPPPSNVDPAEAAARRAAARAYALGGATRDAVSSGGGRSASPKAQQKPKVGGGRGKKRPATAVASPPPALSPAGAATTLAAGRSPQRLVAPPGYAPIPSPRQLHHPAAATNARRSPAARAVAGAQTAAMAAPAPSAAVRPVPAPRALQRQHQSAPPMAGASPSPTATAAASPKARRSSHAESLARVAVIEAELAASKARTAARARANGEGAGAATAAGARSPAAIGSGGARGARGKAAARVAAPAARTPGGGSRAGLDSDPGRLDDVDDEYAKFVRSLCGGAGDGSDLASLVSLKPKPLPALRGDGGPVEGGIGGGEDEEDDEASYHLQSEEEDDDDEDDELEIDFAGMLGPGAGAAEDGLLRGMAGDRSVGTWTRGDALTAHHATKGAAGAKKGPSASAPTGPTSTTPWDDLPPSSTFYSELEEELGGLLEEDLEAAFSTLLGQGAPRKAGGPKGTTGPLPPAVPPAAGAGKAGGGAAGAPGGCTAVAGSGTPGAQAAAAAAVSSPAVAAPPVPQLPEPEQVAKLRSLLAGHYQVLLQQAVLAVRAANVSQKRGGGSSTLAAGNGSNSGHGSKFGKSAAGGKQAGKGSKSGKAAVSSSAKGRKKGGEVPSPDAATKDKHAAAYALADLDGSNHSHCSFVPRANPADFFHGGETSDDLAEILDGAVGMLQDLDQNRKDAIRNSIQLEAAAAAALPKRCRSLLPATAPPSATAQTADAAGGGGALLASSGEDGPRRLTRAAFNETLKVRAGAAAAHPHIHHHQAHASGSRSGVSNHSTNLSLSLCGVGGYSRGNDIAATAFDARGLALLGETFSAIDSSVMGGKHSEESSGQGDVNVLQPLDHGDACELLLRRANADYDPSFLPGRQDLSEHLSYPSEALGQGFRPPMTCDMCVMLRKNKGQFTAAEDNLILRGVNLYGEKEWLLLSDRYLPDRSVSAISQRYSRLCVLIYRASGVRVDVDGNLPKPPHFPNGPEDFDLDAIAKLPSATAPARFSTHRWSLDEDICLLKAVPYMGHMWAEIVTRLMTHRDRGHVRKRYQVLERRIMGTFKREKKMGGSCSMARISAGAASRSASGKRPAPASGAGKSVSPPKKRKGTAKSPAAAPPVPSAPPARAPEKGLRSPIAITSYPRQVVNGRAGAVGHAPPVPGATAVAPGAGTPAGIRYAQPKPFASPRGPATAAASAAARTPPPPSSVARGAVLPTPGSRGGVFPRHHPTAPAAAAAKAAHPRAPAPRVVAGRKPGGRALFTASAAATKTTTTTGRNVPAASDMMGMGSPAAGMAAAQSLTALKAGNNPGGGGGGRPSAPSSAASRASPDAAAAHSGESSAPGRAAAAAAAVGQMTTTPAHAGATPRSLLPGATPRSLLPTPGELRIDLTPRTPAGALTGLALPSGGDSTRMGFERILLDGGESWSQMSKVKRLFETDTDSHMIHGGGNSNSRSRMASLCGDFHGSDVHMHHHPAAADATSNGGLPTIELDGDLGNSGFSVLNNIADDDNNGQGQDAGKRDGDAREGKKQQPSIMSSVLAGARRKKDSTKRGAGADGKNKKKSAASSKKRGGPKGEKKLASGAEPGTPRQAAATDGDFFSVAPGADDAHLSRPNSATAVGLNASPPGTPLTPLRYQRHDGEAAAAQMPGSSLMPNTPGGASAVLGMVDGAFEFSGLSFSERSRQAFEVGGGGDGGELIESSATLSRLAAPPAVADGGESSGGGAFSNLMVHAAAGASSAAFAGPNSLMATDLDAITALNSLSNSCPPTPTRAFGLTASSAAAGGGEGTPTTRLRSAGSGDNGGGAGGGGRPEKGKDGTGNDGSSGNGFGGGSKTSLFAKVVGTHKSRQKERQAAARKRKQQQRLA